MNVVAPILPPPTERYSVLGWLHKNLFSTWYNTLLTLATLAVLYLGLRPALDWALNVAKWEVVSVNLRLFIVGRYPVAELWRAWLCVIAGAWLVGLTWGLWLRTSRAARLAAGLLPFALALLPLEGTNRALLVVTGVSGWIGYGLGRFRAEAFRRPTVIAWLLYFPLVIVLIHGLGPEGQPFGVVPSSLWGGLLLTSLLTVVGIVFSFPLGVLLALGRQSQFVIIRSVCVVFIEFVRGVPFVSVIFMAQFMLPLFLPQGMTLDAVVRAMAAVTLFSAAYLAENVRGGLQAIPRGQFEAARALGLNPAQTMGLIILPQALRLVIPILVGQFIALFKDTSLVVIVGLLDLMGIAKSVLAQPDFLGRQAEVYLFLALVYGVFCYFMSALSQRLEQALGVGQR